MKPVTLLLGIALMSMAQYAQSQNRVLKTYWNLDYSQALPESSDDFKLKFLRFSPAFQWESNGQRLQEIELS